MIRSAAVVLVTIAAVCVNTSAQNAPASNAQALSYAAQSIAAMTQGSTISDVTLTGMATWTAGSDTETGAATLLALGTGESSINLALSGGTRTEIRDASSGTPRGKWTNQTGATGMFSFHNCQTDAAWFFPALSSLTAGPNIVLSYVGPETRNGESVQHLRSYVYSPSSTSAPSFQQLSAEDFYLDATTLLPSAVTFSTHPDNNAANNVSVEVDFSNYQAVNGAVVPMHVQKYLQGTLQIDLTVSSAAFNTGIALSHFTIN
jgi:hypothetical protein